MGLADRIVSWIPQLRRFGRALTGSQTSGDAYVAATLEALAEDPEPLNRADNTGVAIYGAFCRIWRTLEVNTKSDAPASAWEAKAGERLSALVPQERLVFLLRSLEGFTASETAQILELSEDDVDRLMQEASNDIASQLSSKVLIIEDEPLIALDLVRLVTGLGHHVSSVAQTHKEAIAAVAEEQPELILADVQLADGSSGIEAVKEILTSYTPPVVFITAFPDRLLTGERPEPTFLISKPYDPEAVKAMISQVLFFQSSAQSRKVA